MEIKELAGKLNNEKHVQKGYWEDDLSDILKDISCVKVCEGLDVDKHRWYETTIVVYEVILDGGTSYLGVRVCSDLFSESSSWDDISWDFCFFEMEKTTIVTYKPKAVESVAV